MNPAAKQAAGPGGEIVFRDAVRAEWIDINRHMHISSYDKVFDAAESAFFELFGIRDDYIARTDLSCFRLEKFVRYERELLHGDLIEVRSRIVWTDFRRIHHFHELWNTGANYRAAYSDALSIHVDLKRRKAVFVEDPEIRLPLEALATAGAALPAPAGLAERVNGRRTDR